MVIKISNLLLKAKRKCTENSGIVLHFCQLTSCSVDDNWFLTPGSAFCMLLYFVLIEVFEEYLDLHTHVSGRKKHILMILGHCRYFSLILQQS
jgi:hypothetical protein